MEIYPLCINFCFDFKNQLPEMSLLSIVILVYKHVIFDMSQWCLNVLSNQASLGLVGNQWFLNIPSKQASSSVCL